MQSDIHRLPGSLKLLERKATYNGNELEKLIEESDAKLTVNKTIIDTVMNRIEELEDDVSDLKKYNHETHPRTCAELSNMEVVADVQWFKKSRDEIIIKELASKRLSPL
ncbi:hypothetical protein QAD02_013353 [Eretmocerus hayati]|uniref:Uncharacterized protein n=1 Tax=Eretmocerus hayati TaxID=131215 RepID=A0ACC2P3C8_9HYME|nr:hypothetical protein QAD02_013353 [Eretmocerus hayati]